MATEHNTLGLENLQISPSNLSSSSDPAPEKSVALTTQADGWATATISDDWPTQNNTDVWATAQAIDHTAEIDGPEQASPEGHVKPASSLRNQEEPVRLKPDAEKKQPYINPERVKTGGTQREKLSEQELAERMAKMKEQNRRINERRKDVKADEEAFKASQESERIKYAHTRQVQQKIDHTREQNAQRKLLNTQSREWDSGKQTGGWTKPNKHAASTSADHADNEASTADDTNHRPRGRGRGRGGNVRRSRGRGRGVSHNINGQASEQPPPSFDAPQGDLSGL